MKTSLVKYENAAETEVIGHDDRTQTAIDFARKHQVFLAAATSDNTRRAYRSAIRHFLAWGGTLPSNERAIIAYLLAYAQSLNPRTLALRLTALAQWHTSQGFTDPTATVMVRKTLAGMMRIHGRPPQKAKALLLEDMKRIIAHLAQLNTLNAKRDNALLQIAYFGAFRRSEVVRLEIEHITWDKAGLVITLPRSKTDQTGQGMTKAIPLGEGLYCPTTALHTWLTAAGLTSGALFRPITRWGKIGTQFLHEASVNTILTNCAKMIHLDYLPQLSSHSLRRGLATSAYRAGARFQDIKRQGGWRHNGTVQGYIEEAGQFEDNAAASLLRNKKNTLDI